MQSGQASALGRLPGSSSVVIGCIAAIMTSLRSSARRALASNPGSPWLPSLPGLPGLPGLSRWPSPAWPVAGMPSVTKPASTAPSFAAGAVAATSQLFNAASGIDVCSASAGSCTTPTPPHSTIVRSPAAPSSREPESTTPITRSPMPNAALRNSTSTAGRWPFSRGPRESRTRPS